MDVQGAAAVTAGRFGNSGRKDEANRKHSVAHAWRSENNA
jgi:hypothetical protein